MWTTYCLIGAILLGQSAPVPLRALNEQIDAFLERPEYKRADWGILVADAKTGEVLYSRAAERFFLPASTTKLYSCTAALKGLGPDHRFETEVFFRGTKKDGVLTGDLILIASGDVTMGGRDDGKGKMAFENNDHTYAGGASPCEVTTTNPLRGLEDLAAQVKKAGIDQVQGDVLIDDRLFEKAKGSGSGPDLLTPIVINDNVVDLILTPAAEAGKPARVQMIPENSYYQLDVDVKTVEKGKPTRVEVRATATRGIWVRGEIPVGAKPYLAIAHVADPTSFARAMFLQCLKKAGVRVSASALQEPTAPLHPKEGCRDLTLVATHRSLPLSELVKVILKVSHNLYASTLPLVLAAKEGKTTLRDGLRVQQRLLRDLGLDLSAVSFGGAAGGANADHVTPSASVQLLRLAAAGPSLKAIFDGLPILGVDGTLADVVPGDSPAKGKVMGKTGTLSWLDVMNDRLLVTSKALAGVMTTAKNRQLIIAIYVNKVPLPKGSTASREGKAIGKLCELIYLHSP